MKIRYLRDATVANLRDTIIDNIDRYRSGDFGFLDLDSSQYLELPVDTVDSALSQMRLPVGEDHYEVENCTAVHNYLANLSAYEARDERLWCHLTHTVLLEYTLARWPIPSDDNAAVKHIHTHFFAKTARNIERDNAASRLWWIAHLCKRVPDISHNDALEAFLYRQDVRAQVLDRPTVSQSTNVFSVILRKLMTSSVGEKALFNRVAFRKVMMELNSIGGFKLLDSLPEKELVGIFDDVITNKVGISVL
jgi:hypothetical protein